jgi:benzylsuccinate CoA-transferase BbsF subunit
MKNTVRLPLTGVRVLELGHAWAGPHCAELLCDLGAEIIKVEPPEGDMLRGGRRRAGEGGTYSQGRQGSDPWNRAVVFNEINRGKLSIGVDLQREEGKALLAKLLKISDIVICNLTVGAMEKLGLGYERLKAVKPDIILVTLNAYGLTGPWAKYRTYGVVLEPMCGFFSLTGYTDDEAPIRSGVDHIDPLSGAHAAGAALAALLYRQKTGKGQHINLSFLESAVNFIGPEILEYTVNSRVRGHSGNRHSSMAPHGCYRCQGDDQWVTIAIGCDEEWQNFCGAMGNPSWTKDEEFSTQSNRLKNQDKLDKLVENWTSERDKYEVMHTLQRAGVASGCVLNTKELLNDPHLRRRDYFHTTQRSDLGSLEVIGTRAKLSKTPTYVSGPPPRYGEHKDYVFGELLNMSTKQIDELVDKGIIFTEPRS